MPNEHFLYSQSFCVIDLETTGGNHERDKIIEIGLVSITGLQIKKTLSYLINPEISIPQFIQRLTSISPSGVQSAPIIEDVIEEILEFIGDSILVAHNASFDIPFLNSILQRINRTPLPNKSICTNIMTKYLIPELMNSNLNYMSKIFKIKHSKAHRALEDATATAELFINYLHFFLRKGITKINQLYYPKNQFELDRLHIKYPLDSDYLREVLEKIDRPILVIVKGNKGIILSSTVFLFPTREIQEIAHYLKTFEYEIVTFKLFGTVGEALFKLNHLFFKMPADERSRVINTLYHHPQFNHFNTTMHEESQILFSPKYFMVVHHLIPEQFGLFATMPTAIKSEIIFRYPAHKKKLEQFIGSFHKKNKSNPAVVKVQGWHPEFMPFLSQFLFEIKNKSRIDHALVRFEDIFGGKDHDIFLQSSEKSKYPLVHL